MRIFKNRWLLFLFVFLLAAACLAAPCYLIYMNARNVIVGELGNNAIDIAVSIAAFIEKDIEEYSVLPAQIFIPDDASVDPMPSDWGAGDGYYDDGYYDDGYYDDGYYGDGYYGDGYYDDGYYGDGYYGDGYYGDGYYGEGYYYDDFGNVYYYDGYYVYYDESSDEYRAIINNGDTDGLPLDESAVPQVSYDEEYFAEIMVLLEKIKNETGAADIYTEKKLSDTRKGFVFKEGSEAEKTSLSGEMTEEEILAFNEGVKSSTGVLMDESSEEFIRGYAPIVSMDTEKPVGVVVVEFMLSDAVGLTSEIMFLIISSFLTLAVLITIVVYRLALSRMIYRSKDVLTELCNKRYFEKSLRRAVRSAKRSKRPLSVMMIDIDKFKSINDTMGHPTGDIVIKAVSEVLLGCTRREDACCRYGGDEFVIMLPDAGRAQAAAIAERIRQQAGALVFGSPRGRFGITLSIGVAEYSRGMTAEKFKETADRTLYYSKNNGKNRITVCEDT